jgi:hypothetical protein
MWSANDPQARRRLKMGPSGGKNQDFEATPVFSQSPIKTAIAI